MEFYIALKKKITSKTYIIKKNSYKYADKVMKNSLLIACHHGLKINFKDLLTNGVINSFRRSTSLKLSRSLKSNKELSYRILAQIASSVPKRLRFEQVEYNGTNRVTIMGVASSDQDILNFIENLGKQKLIKQASLSSMKLPRGKSSGGAQMKGFRIFVKIKG